MREVAVHVLDAGWCSHPEAMTLRGGTWRATPFPALPALLLHPIEGPVLFDTGYAPAFTEATQTTPERFYRWLTPMHLPDGHDAASRCRELGVSPDEVRHVVLSHFHADHVAGLRAFGRAAVHCARAGFVGAMQGGRFRSVCNGVLRGLLPVDLPERTLFFEDRPRVALPRDLHPFKEGADLLGDGSLLAVELPGHCPGHWGLLVADRARGLHFLVGDAAWSSDAITRNVPPPAITTAFLGTTGVARRTLAALHSLRTRNADVLITPYHCRQRAAAVRAEAGGPP